MRLLFVIKGLVVAAGGAERVFVDVVNALSNRGHDVHVATFDSPGQKLFYDLRPDVPVHMLGVSPPGVPTPRRRLVSAVRALRRLAARLQPDVAVGFMHSSYVILSVALWGLKTKLVLSEHIDAAHYADRPLERILSRLAFRQAVLKTVPSEPVRLEHSAKDRPRVVTVANPLAFNPDLKVPKAAARQPVILSVGRFMAQKDFPTLIHAFSLLAHDFPEWRLRIVGDGPLRPQIEKMTADSSCPERIELPGAVKDVAEEYLRASIFALPSLYESFGLVLGEAMSNGCPVIAFSGNLGAENLIRNGDTGLLIQPRTDRVSEFAGGLRALMGDADRRDYLASRARPGIARFALPSIVDEWERLLRLAHY